MNKFTKGFLNGLGVMLCAFVVLVVVAIVCVGAGFGAALLAESFVDDPYSEAPAVAFACVTVFTGIAVVFGLIGVVVELEKNKEDE